MNILVTGGAGYIGSALVNKLANRMDIDSIVVYDNLSRDNHNLFTQNLQPNAVGKVKLEYGDLLDSRKLRKVMKGIDVVYHLAARTSSPSSDLDSHFYEQTNHWGTAELIYAVEESTTVKKLIFTSSTAVYGSTEGDMQITETTEPNPKTFYGISKLRGEAHVQRLLNSEKTKTLIFRIANVYGFAPALRFDTVINRFMFDANFKNKISIHGSGSQVRSYIHVNQVVAALEQAMGDDLKAGIYNLSDKQLSLLDMLDTLKEIYPPLEFIFINQHITPHHQKIANTAADHGIVMESKELMLELFTFKQKFTF